MKRSLNIFIFLLFALFFQGCFSSVGVGTTIPIGHNGGIGTTVSVGSDGHVYGNVGVGGVIR